MIMTTRLGVTAIRVRHAVFHKPSIIKPRFVYATCVQSASARFVLLALVAGNFRQPEIPSDIRA
jgi:hypothetical protein